MFIMLSFITECREQFIAQKSFCFFTLQFIIFRGHISAHFF